MKVKILDVKNEGEARCYLCKVDLYDYVANIPESYQDFSVQRGIVNNQYLDSLSDTVAKKLHIPPIVLISEEFIEKDNFIDIKNFRILDGLQRTHRLRVILLALSFILDNKNDPDLLDNTNRFYRRNSSELKKIGANNKLLKKLISHDVSSLGQVEDFFNGNTLWLEVWSGLSEEAQIRKMLMLNAGHKAVNIKHQLELLFLSTLFKLEEITPPDVEFVREKEVSAITYSKSRKVGHYHFSHIISSLVALSAGKLVNTNADFISEIQNGTLKDIDLVESFDMKLLKNVIEFLFNLDVELSKQYGDIGTKWIGREVVLVGLFGAIGNFSKENSSELHDLLHKLTAEIEAIVSYLDLNEFEQQRNKVKLNKVNVGNVNRRAVYSASLNYFLNAPDSKADWLQYFGGEK
ncbi:MAG: hypothetical protein ACI9O6_003496 [Glaciecola sp.]|jgi:hypothetical protein